MEEAGVAGTNSVLPTLRLFKALDEGAASCAILARVPIPEARYDKLAPIGKDIQLGAIPKKSVLLEKYEDLVGLKIAVPRGVFVGDPFDHDIRLKKILTDSYDLSSVLFKFDRVDAVVGAYDSLLFNMQRAEIEPERIGLPLIFSSAPMWVMCQPGKVSSDQRARLITATERLRSNGTIARIIKKYLQADPAL
ncbi:transporter substrate-binding domain-containing protein [Kiloniella laminariae]|uniref:transporter substrate-binding domain-containing protein n=1 Tax=Kiloniella laminariae TaxID=454162 RepID=UPI00038185F7